jgi:hypothetical protein
MPKPEESLLLGALCTAGVAALIEHAVGSLRTWAVGHPVTVAFLTGAILLLLTVFGVERWLSRAESVRWSTPAREALNTWLFAADAAVRAIWERAATTPSASDSLGEPRAPDEAIRRLAETDPERLRELSDFVRERAQHAVILAMNVIGIVARYEPLAGATTGVRGSPAIRRYRGHMSTPGVDQSAAHRSGARKHHSVGE